MNTFFKSLRAALYWGSNAWNVVYQHVKRSSKGKFVINYYQFAKNISSGEHTFHIEDYQTWQY